MAFQPLALRMIWRSKVHYIGKGIQEQPIVPAVSEPVMGLEAGSRRHRRLLRSGWFSSVRNKNRTESITIFIFGVDLGS